MSRKIMELMKKYKQMILYLLFGGLTTAANIVAYWLMAHIVHAGTTVSTVVAWAAAVLFAYATNRKWVFESKESSAAGVIKEMASFFACRMLTGALDVAIMYVFVDVLCFNDMLIKIVSNLLVIILNYIASKLFVFKK